MARMYSQASRFVLKITRPGADPMSITRSGGLMKFDLNDHGIQTYRDKDRAHLAKINYTRLLNDRHDYMIDVVDVAEEFPEQYEPIGRQA